MTKRRPARPHPIRLLAIVCIGQTSIVIRDDGRPFDRLRIRETLVTALVELRKDKIK